MLPIVFEEECNINLEEDSTVLQTSIWRKIQHCLLFEIIQGRETTSHKRFPSLSQYHEVFTDLCTIAAVARREYKIRYDWMGKVIYWESCKKFKFDNMNKSYIHYPEFVLET